MELPAETLKLPNLEGASNSNNSFISEYLANNAFFHAGAGLTGIGLALALLKKTGMVAKTIFQRQFIHTFEMDSTDVTYPYVLSHLYRKSSSLRLSGKSTVQKEGGLTKVITQCHPNYGVSYCYCNHRYVKVERQRQTPTVGGNVAPFETLTLSTFGRDSSFFPRLVSEASEELLQEYGKGLVFYEAVRSEWCRKPELYQKRSLDSVILVEGLKEKIQNDLEEFLRTEVWYLEKGIPYRRGYLFYGPPGTGKTSYIAALASHHGFGICTLSLSARTLDDQQLKHLLNTVPADSFVVLEDVDAAFVAPDAVQKQRAYEGISRVTLSGLLNAVDGLACSEKRILFMTTNYPELLNRRLVRPGRVDKKYLFGYCTNDMIIQMFKHFYGNEVDGNLAVQFLQKVKELKSELSPAEVQKYLLSYKKDPVSAVENLTRCVLDELSYLTGNVTLKRS